MEGEGENTGDGRAGQNRRKKVGTRDRQHFITYI